MSKQKHVTPPDVFSDQDLKNLEKYLGNGTSLFNAPPKDIAIMQCLWWEIKYMKCERPNVHPEIIKILKSINADSIGLTNTKNDIARTTLEATGVIKSNISFTASDAISAKIIDLKDASNSLTNTKNDIARTTLEATGVIKSNISFTGDKKSIVNANGGITEDISFGTSSGVVNLADDKVIKDAVSGQNSGIIIFSNNPSLVEEGIKGLRLMEEVGNSKTVDLSKTTMKNIGGLVVGEKGILSGGTTSVSDNIHLKDNSSFTASNAINAKIIDLKDASKLLLSGDSSESSSDIT